MSRARPLPFPDAEIGESSRHHPELKVIDVLEECQMVAINVTNLFQDLNLENEIEKLPETIHRVDSTLSTIVRLQMK